MCPHPGGCTLYMVHIVMQPHSFQGSLRSISIKICANFLALISITTVCVPLYLLHMNWRRILVWIAVLSLCFTLSFQNSQFLSQSVDSNGIHENCQFLS
jgi:type IV secretory pathway VirB2 component (pilin)